MWYQLSLSHDLVSEGVELAYCLCCIYCYTLVLEEGVPCAAAYWSALWVCQNYEEFSHGEGILKSLQQVPITPRPRIRCITLHQTAQILAADGDAKNILQQTARITEAIVNYNTGGVGLLKQYLAGSRAADIKLEGHNKWAAGFLPARVELGDIATGRVWELTRSPEGEVPVVHKLEGGLTRVDNLREAEQNIRRSVLLHLVLPASAGDHEWLQES